MLLEKVPKIFSQMVLVHGDESHGYRVEKVEIGMTYLHMSVQVLVPNIFSQNLSHVSNAAPHPIGCM